MRRVVNQVGRSIHGSVSVLVIFGASVLGCASHDEGGGLAPPVQAATPPRSPAAALPARTGAVERAQMTDADLASMVSAALADAAGRAPPGGPAPELVSAESVTWSDGSLGCPVPGRMYTMALVPGYRIRIRSGADVLDYHAGKRGRPVLCPAGRAKEPAPNSSV